MGGDRRLVSSGQALSVLVRQEQISHRKVTLPDPRKAGPLSQASHHEDTELKLGLVRERVGSDPERGHFLLNGCTSQRPPEKQNQQAGYAPGRHVRGGAPQERTGPEAERTPGRPAAGRSPAQPPGPGPKAGAPASCRPVPSVVPSRPSVGWMTPATPVSTGLPHSAC